jgi:hypothetical protein
MAAGREIIQLLVRPSLPGARRVVRGAAVPATARGKGGGGDKVGLFQPFTLAEFGFEFFDLFGT